MDIIIVDDTQTAIDALAKKLKNYPNVTVAGFANNGKDGLELLKTTHAEVVFLDVEMPDMTGIDFLGRMKDEGCKDTLAVVYTAYGTYTLPALRNKAFDFLMKPIDGNELETVMARLEEELEDIRVEREQLEERQQTAAIYQRRGLQTRRDTGYLCVPIQPRPESMGSGGNGMRHTDTPQEMCQQRHTDGARREFRAGEPEIHHQHKISDGGERQPVLFLPAIRRHTIYKDR